MSGYQEAIVDNYAKVCNRTVNMKATKLVNNEIPPDFTYGDLKHLLRCDEPNAFKINIEFGSMLFDTVNKVYRYFYGSSNHLLFDRAFTISTNRDMTAFC